MLPFWQHLFASQTFHLWLLLTHVSKIPPWNFLSPIRKFARNTWCCLHSTFEQRQRKLCSSGWCGRKHQAFSRPLSAVSAWNWAACVGSISYLHTGIWNLNDTNIRDFYWRELAVQREESFKTFDSFPALFSHHILSVLQIDWRVLEDVNKRFVALILGFICSTLFSVFEICFCTLVFMREETFISFDSFLYKIWTAGAFPEPFWGTV